MSDTIALVLIVLVALLLGAVCVFAGVVIGRWSQQAQPAPEPGPYDDFAEDEADEEELPALKVDPANPPTWKIYKGSGGPRCNCHDRRIQYGENILMWPDPENPGAFRLFHEDFVEGMKPGA